MNKIKYQLSCNFLQFYIISREVSHFVVYANTKYPRSFQYQKNIANVAIKVSLSIQLHKNAMIM